MTISRAVVGCAAGLLLAFAAPASARPDREDFVQAYDRDVYVIVGSTLRNPTDDTAPGAPLYNVAGVALDLTWGQFTGATATARARQSGSAARPLTDIRIELGGLVPGGLYSLFYLTLGPDSENPLCPGVERALALHAFHPADEQPDAASFYAAADGSAAFHARVDGALLDAQQLVYEVVYHNYGQSYGELPNAGEFLTQGENCRSSFGEDSVRHLLVFQTFS